MNKKLLTTRAFLTRAFPIRAGLIALLAIAACMTATTANAAGSKSHAAAKTKAEPAKPIGETVEYPALENRVGQEIVIDTTLKTTRRGKLIKYTQPALTLQIGTETHPIELTVPRETIKTIMVVAPTPEPAKDERTSGAKKN
jgi:hypothetical protein